MSTEKTGFNDRRPYDDDPRHDIDREIEDSKHTLIQHVAEGFIKQTERISSRVVLRFGEANCMMTTARSVYFVFGYCLPRNQVHPEINERVERDNQAIVNNFERALRQDPDGSEGGRLLKALGIDQDGRNVRVLSVCYDLDTRHAHVRVMLSDDDDFLADVDADTLEDASDTHIPDPLEML
jgi:hypothetical protein